MVARLAHRGAILLPVSVRRADLNMNVIVVARRATPLKPQKR
jgi:hypothetical protein